jgi:N-formylglutamate deformylase
MAEWLQIARGQAPLIVSMPHTGTDIPADIVDRLASPWLARKDADWHIEKLYAFAPELGATIVRTMLSRTVIDLNRDPSGASLYPGQATTELCPTTTFDGEPLYRDGQEPNKAEITRRKAAYFVPYHAVLAGEIARLRAKHANVVLYEAHSIRSFIPRLFDGRLPDFNIGTNNGESCSGGLTGPIERICDATGYLRVTDERFKGGWTTRHYGKPTEGVHAIQLELACRGYMDEPQDVTPDNWPTPYDEQRAAGMRAALKQILQACLTFASMP